MTLKKNGKIDDGLAKVYGKRKTPPKYVYLDKYERFTKDVLKEMSMQDAKIKKNYIAMEAIRNESKQTKKLAIIVAVVATGCLIAISLIG